LTALPDDGIVVVEVEKGISGMVTVGLSGALRERLGDQATLGLLDLLEEKGCDWSDNVLSVAGDRFGRTLAEETGRLRVEIANLRADLLKWSFLFWVGQVAAMAGLLAFMLRTVGH